MTGHPEGNRMTRLWALLGTLPGWIAVWLLTFEVKARGY